MNFVKGRNLFGKGPSKEIPCIIGSGAPTTATEGAVGSLYIDTSPHATLYKCIHAADGVYTWAPVLDEDAIHQVVNAYMESYAFGAVTVKGTDDDPNGDGFYMVSEGTAEAPVLGLYGQNSDENVILRRVADPVQNKDAANKEYVDRKVAESSGENLDYSTAANKPSINGVTLEGNKTAEELGIGLPTNEQVGNAVGEYLDEHPELATNVADKSITPAKTTFIEPVVQNLIDISKMVKGGIAEATGEIGTTAGYTSDYIPVETGKTYRCNVGFGTGGNWTSWYYDASKTPLSKVAGNPFTVPDGAAWVRLSWYFTDDPATKKYTLIEGQNMWPYTQGIQRYELDEMLTAAVERVVDGYAAVKATPKNLYRQAGYGNVNSTTGVIDCGDSGSLRVSDYIEITPGVWYITNCLSTTGFSACYDADKTYVAAFADVTERIGTDGYAAFRVTDPNVRYIVNGCEKTISMPIAEPFFCLGSAVPETFDGYDVAVPHADIIAALKKLLGVTGNDLSGMTWAVLGNSITAASGSTKSYHGIIAAKLGLNAINYGYNGSWVSYTDAMPEGNEMCTRYATMTDDADLITVCGGTNDINNGATLGQMGDTEKTTFYGALDILCRGLLEKYPGKRIYYITPLYYGNDDKAAPYIKAIFEVCKQYGIPVIDLYYTGPFAGAPAAMRGLYLYDGLHPNEAGHEAMAYYIAQQMEWR